MILAALFGLASLFALPAHSQKIPAVQTSFTGVNKAADQIEQVVFSRDDDRLFIRGSDGRTLEWNLTDGSVRPLFAQPSMLLTGLAQRLALLEEGQISLWKGNNLEGQFQPDSIFRESAARVAALSPFSILVALAAQDQIGVYNVRTGELRQEFDLAERPVRLMQFSSDGRYLAAALETGQLIIWNTKDWKPVDAWTSIYRTVPPFAWHPGTTMLAYAEGKTLYLRDVRRDEQWTLRKAAAADIRQVAIHPLYDQLVLALANGQIQLVNLRTGDIMTTLETIEPDCRQISFSHDGRLLGVVSPRGLELYDSANGRLVVSTTVAALRRQLDTRVVDQAVQPAPAHAGEPEQ